MLRYILKSIKKYYDYFIFMVLGIFVIMTIFPLGVSSLMKIKVTVQGDISKYGRGTYDLLVRNPDSLTKVEKDLKLIDESYAANAKGGISMKQYEDIKKIKGIEVAAPIANLGYFQNKSNYVTIYTKIGQGVKMDVTFQTWDGPNYYNLGEATVYQTPALKEFLTDEYKSNYEFDKEKNTFKYAPYVIGNGGIQSTGYLAYTGKGIEPVKGVMFKMPTTYSSLYAVDPEQEKSIGKEVAMPLLTRKVVELKGVEDYLTGKVYDKVNQIEVLANSESPIRLRAMVKLSKLNASQDQLQAIINKNNLGENLEVNLDNDEVKNNKDLSGKAKSIMNEMEKYVDKDDRKGAINFDRMIIPFNPINHIAINCADYSFSPEFSGINVSKKSVMGTEHYTVNEVNYDGDKNSLSPKAIGANNGIIIFSDKSKSGISTEDVQKGNASGTPIVFHTFFNMGIIDENILEYGDKINGSPSGVYGGDSIKQVENVQGKKVNRYVEKTSEIGSLGRTRPNAYTTIDAAPLIKGDKPIDAIRVKVAEITSYNNEAKEKIERVATEIYNKTGLKVDFVAGSSTTKTFGAAEGKDGIEGLGKVEKRWVTLGTDSLVTTNWNTSAFVLMIAFIACGCLFVINRINSYMILRKREMNTLECTGWDKKYIAFVITGENILAYIISSIFAVAVLLKMKMDKSVIIASVVIIFFIIILVSYFYTLKYKDKSKKRGYRSLSFTMVKLVLSDIVRNKNRYILLMTQLILTATLALFTLMSFNATRQSVSYTTLGSQVNMSTNSIVKPIIMGSIILIIFTTFDRFTSLMLERKQEITLLKTLGWSKRKISGLMYGSLIMIGFIVTAATLGLTSLIGVMFYKTIPIKGIHMVGIALIILAICVIGGVYPIVNCLRKTVLKYSGSDR